MPALVRTKVFLSVHLRVLLKSLHRGDFRRDCTVPADVYWLARPLDRMARACLDREPVHEHLQPSSVGHQERTARRGNQKKGCRLSQKEQSASVTSQRCPSLLRFLFVGGTPFTVNRIFPGAVHWIRQHDEA